MFVALMRFVGETVGRGDTRALHGLLGWAWRIEGVLAVLGGGALVAAGLLGATPRAAWLFAAVACTASTVQAIPTAVLIGLQLSAKKRRSPASSRARWLSQRFRRCSQGGGITGMFAVEAVVATQPRLDGPARAPRPQRRE